jgi:hypothetical protein
MAELQFHSEGKHANDPMGKRVGIMAAILAVLLAVVTIASHRAHTKAIMDKSRANDDWAYYQATRGKYHNIELGETLVGTFGNNRENADKVLRDYAVQKKKYEGESKQIQAKALADDHDAEVSEQRALRYDIGEGFLEIALVLSSLFFIARRQMFPIMGATAGILGTAVAAMGLMI